MIITKTPLRISFVGGGSDIQAYYSRKPGHVVSAAIDKYIYISVNKKIDKKIRLVYSEIEEVDNVKDVKHPIIRETLNYFSVKTGIEIISVADIPASGSGLGSSSAFTVGLVRAISQYIGIFLTPNMVAEIAVDIEINKCSEPIGKQDQYASSYGGFNSINFLSNGDVQVQPITRFNASLEDSLLLIYTGKSRSAGYILAEQVCNMSNDEIYINHMDDIVKLSKIFLENISGDIRYLGGILHESWQIKKKMAHSISSSQIDHIYNAALEAGAYGGKLLGAGGGGFLLLITSPDKKEIVRRRLSEYESLNVKISGSPLITEL